MEKLGAILYEARVAKNISLSDLEARTKIRSQYLAALEQGELDQLPGEVYVRGFLRSYAKAVGLAPDDIMVLQPTRIVPRKGIEHAIKLVQMLDDPRIKLVISHEAGDEGDEYRHVLAEIAREAGVDLRFVATRISDVRHRNREGHKVYTLWDLYPHADLVTYPSLYEGFGNAFLEAIYFRVPVLINRYAIFARDIEPKGFRLPIMDGYLTRSTIEEVRRLINDKEYRHEVASHNYQVASRFFSYRVLRRALRTLIAEVTGL